MEYMAESVKRGALENHEVKGLTQATNYYLLVFGVDNANDYAASTPVKMVKFKTAEAQQSSCTFEIKSNVYLTTAALTVTPRITSRAGTLSTSLLMSITPTPLPMASMAGRMRSSSRTP